MTYQRRLAILSNLLKESQKAKPVLKEKVPLLRDSDTYLEKKFRTHIEDVEKSKKKINKVFRGVSPTISSSKPFQSLPSSISSRKLYEGGDDLSTQRHFLLKKTTNCSGTTKK